MDQFGIYLACVPYIRGLTHSSSAKSTFGISGAGKTAEGFAIQEMGVSASLVVH